MVPRFFITLGRMGMSLLFLVMALNQIFDWQAAEQELSMTVMDWQNEFEGNGLATAALTFVYNNTYIVLGCALLAQLLGGLSLLFGTRMKGGVLLLLAVWIPVTVFQHPFWLLDGVQRDNELMGFLHNLAIFGGLAALLGAGEHRRRRLDFPPMRFRRED